MHFVDIRSETEFVIVRKVASTSLVRSLCGGCIEVRLRPAGFRRVAFVRHPYDRLCSFYQGNFPRVWRVPFPEFVDWVLSTDARNSHVTPISRLLPEEMDFVGRFENLAEDWEVARTYFSHVRPLRHLNKGGDTPWQTLFDALDDERREALNDLYHDDFERFGYG